MKIASNKGFSIAEVVIALAIISIVTITAISISSLSSANTQAFLNKADAQYLVADAIECFKATPCKSVDDYDEFCEGFFEAFRFRGGLTPSSSDVGEHRLFLMDKSRYLVEVTIQFNHNEEKAELLVTVRDVQKDTIVAQEYYVKSVYEVR